jgi:putative heme-binding domain-containing protein
MKDFLIRTVPLLAAPLLAAPLLAAPLLAAPLLAALLLAGMIAPGSSRAAESIDGDGPIEVLSTLTPLEQQQVDQQRPTYHQPAVVEAAPPVTTLPLSPAAGETLVVLGNGLAERMEHANVFETLLYREFPDRRITFRNLGFPGHTPAFRPEAGRKDPWAFPGAQQFHPEIKGHFGEGHYPSPDEWLRIVDASTIVACFGFNESFAGLEGIENFQRELAAFVQHTRSRSYVAGGETPPRLVLASPIACEAHPELALPDTQARNQILRAYAAAIEAVAREQGVGFVDLFTPSLAWFEQAGQPLTINGVHLSQEGYRRLAPELFRQLFGTRPEPLEPGSLLQRAVADKAWYWRNDYRMLNGVHAYGRRWAPYGNINYPEEIEKIRQLTVLRDRAIWEIAAGTRTALDVDDSRSRPLSPVATNYTSSPKNGSPDYLVEEAEALAAFTLPEGYEVSLFASEQQFPNLGNPCQMRFDNRGRLWVSTLPSYPHYKPGDPKPNDKLLIYEDTDGDGRADKETVFADGLHMPIGFELAPEGVYLSQEPFLLLLKDTDGDDRADVAEYLLDGFDPHDTHHAISAFDVDHGGGIFMCEGRFLHSQVETPWGPQRMTDGGVWRFDPHSWKVERVMQLDVNNPWGVAHDAYGQTFVNDASGGEQIWMLGYSIRMPHAAEMAKVSKFNYEHQVRPTSGAEFISSRHFPDEVQGDYLYANTIGFLGIKDFQVVEDGSEIKGRFRQNLIQSSDGNFRPCDLEIGPDGSLYFLDWHNTLIGHMQHSARDPLRNADYGRIYRITCPARPLVEPPLIAGASIEALFENLKLPELNARKRSQRELRGRERAAVLAAAETFADANRDDERLQLESLWATWGQQAPSRRLLDRCLTARDHRVRAAAVRVVRHCLHLLDQPERLLLAAAGDDHPRVRLEALAAGSWLGGPAGTRIALEVAARPTDPWIRNSLNAAMLTLGDDARRLVETGGFAAKRLSVELDTMLAGRLPGAAKPKNVRTASATFKDKEFVKTYELGQRVFYEEGSCNTCHRDHGRGVTGIYPPLVASEWVLGEPDRLIKLTLHGLWGPIQVAGKRYQPASGVPPMTAVGLFYTDEEIAAVLTYVRNSWGNNAPAVDGATVARIRGETRGRRTFYTPEELLAEHPFPEGSRPALADEPPANPQLQAELAAEPLDALAADALAQGDAVRGAKLFFNEKLACATCHAADFGYQLGPHLTDARSDATRASLVESILHPSKVIREGYQSATVVTADGEVLSGYLVSRTDAEVVLSLPTDKGRTRVLAAEDVDELSLQPQSTMPAGLVGQLEDRQAFLDLARFVFSITDEGRAELRRLKAAAGVGE